jgi:hypothetical protein
MKYSFSMYWPFILVLTLNTLFSTTNLNVGNPTSDMKKSKIKLVVNGHTFTATLLDNNSANAFKQLLPLTIHLMELNGNEKYGDLKASLPTLPTQPKTIQNGDLMLYGATTLVVFYKTFPTSYSYTKIGQVDDAEGLASALGPQSTWITFEL